MPHAHASGFPSPSQKVDIDNVDVGLRLDSTYSPTYPNALRQDKKREKSLDTRLQFVLN